MRPRGSVPAALVPIALVSVAALVLTAGCGTDSDSDLQTREPATAAAAPAQNIPNDQLPGEIAGLDNPIRAVLAEADSGRVAALEGSSEQSTILFLIDPATLRRADRSGVPDLGLNTFSLPARGASLAQGKPGEVLIPAPNRIFHLDVATDTVSETPFDGDARSVQRRPDGTLVVGTADGKVRTVAPDGKTVETISGLASADAIAVTGDHISVLDRRQTSLTQLDLGKDRLGLALRAGAGATNLITDPFGRIIVTDTAGNELLVYTAGPLLLRQRFPVGSSPYALAYDRRSDTVWVTCTQSNEVAGFDLSTGIPKEVGRYPTVRQPNSVTIDDKTGDLFVGSAAGDGVQRIRADQRKEGQ